MPGFTEFDDVYTAGHVCLFILLTITFCAIVIVNFLCWALFRILNEEETWLIISFLNIILCNGCLAFFNVIPTAAYMLDTYWSYGLQLCTTVLSVRQCLYTVLPWTLCSIFIDRLLSFRIGDRYSKIQRSFSQHLIISIWVFSILLNVPWFIEVNDWVNKWKIGESKRFQCVPPNKISSSLYQMMVSYTVPMTVSTIIWLVINLSNRIICQGKIPPRQEEKYQHVYDDSCCSPRRSSHQDTVRRNARKNTIEPTLHGGPNMSVYEVTSDEACCSPRRGSRPDTPWGNKWKNKIDTKLHDGPNTHLPPIETICSQDGIPPHATQAYTSMNQCLEKKSVTISLTPFRERNRNKNLCDERIIPTPSWTGEDENIEKDDRSSRKKINTHNTEERIEDSDINILQVHDKLSNRNTNGDNKDTVEKKSEDDYNNDVEEDAVLYETYLSRILCIPIILYTVLSLPSIIVYVTVTLYDKSSISIPSWLIIQWIADLNLVFNPFLLILTHCDWRQVFKYIILIVRRKKVKILKKDISAVYSGTVSGTD